MDFPKRHDLTCFDEEFESARFDFCSQQWEISVRQKTCIIWSVVLSYLKSADFQIPGQFEERLNQLTNGKVDAELAKKAILGFNPFFNIHKYFFSETLKKVCAEFRNILKEQRGERKRKVAQDLPIISSLLKINILKVNLAYKKLNVITPGSDFSGNVAHITLFYKKHITEENNVQKPCGRFHFGLDEKLCCELRKEALEIILETSEIKTKAKEEILPMLERGEKNINFLITLLKQDSVCPVSYLYDSSYIAGKLSNAGFETDPRVVVQSSGFSAFYYALQSSNSNLVYILYRYAANSCYKSENTFRDPNPSIISNFSKLEEILKRDCAKSNNFEKCGDRAEQARLTYQDLQRFNEFLTEICNSIHDIRNRPESNSMEQAEKQKDIILLILDTYVSERFFSIGQLDLENYTKHKTYYDNLDFNVALLFFDNIFLLKSVLKSPRPRLYSELESSFLLSAVTNKYFTKNIIDVKVPDVDFESDSINLPIIPFLERLNLRENIKNFCSNLREKTLEEDDIVDCIPRKEVTEMLSDFPELKDVSLIFRLDHYLRPALETESGGLKQKLVIQRALKVIGESINVENESSSSIKHLLCKCLPDDTVKLLKKARNDLSDMESYQFPLKFEAEKDDILFTSIQSEIRNIKGAFEEVFDIQRTRLKEFLFNRGVENIKQYKGHLRSVEDFREELLRKGKAQKKKSSELECVLERKKTDGHNASVPSIKEFCRILAVKYERGIIEEQIRGEIPLELKNRTNAIKKLEQDLEGRISVDLERFDSLFLKTKDLCSIKKDYEKYLKEETDSGKSFRRSSLLHKIRKSPNPLNILDLIFKKKKVSNSQLELLHKNIPFSDEAKTTLQSLIGNSEVPCGDNLSNLLNRIKHLQQISIDEQYDIRYLWERAKSSKAKQFLVYKIVQRYFRDSSFQASLEMLLFDCLAIFKNNKEKNNDGRNMERKNNDGSKMEGKNNDERNVAGKNNDERNVTGKNKDERNMEGKNNEEKNNKEKNNDDRNMAGKINDGKNMDRKNNDERNMAGKNNDGRNMDRKNNDEGNMAGKNNDERNIDEKNNDERNIGGKNNLQKNVEEISNEDNFWLKTSYLFNGIDVRNVLAHGDPLVDSIGPMLDPKDFPSELVKKMLQLFEDRECIEGLCDLQQKLKQSDKIPDNCPECQKLKERIVRCGRWQGYCKLLTEDPKSTTTFNGIVAFLEKEPDPKTAK